MGALDTQVGGDHYRTLGIQPVEFAMTQGYDFAAASILKYVTRHRTKAGRQDVEKALHFVGLRSQVVEKHALANFLGAVRAMWRATGLTWFLTISGRAQWQTDMLTYCEANGIAGDDATALLALEDWVNGNAAAEPKLADAIARLVAGYDAGAMPA